MYQLHQLKRIPVTLLLLWLSRVLFTPPTFGSEISEEFRGHWAEEDGQTSLLIGPERIVLETVKGELEVYGLLTANLTDLELLHKGKPVTWHVERDAESLLVQRASKLHRYHVSGVAPSPAIQLRPIPIAAGETLDTSRIISIREDLARRNDKDQKARQTGASSDQIAAIAKENADYLKDLLQDVGWINVDRFGVDAAFDAALIAKHSRDLRIMLSALPHIEHDFKAAGPNAQAFAILYDAIQIRSGKPQRYGTQIGWIDGEPHVLALENASLVDEWRLAIGLSSLGEYLDIAGSQLGKNIQILKLEN